MADEAQGREAAREIKAVRRSRPITWYGILACALLLFPAPAWAETFVDTLGQSQTRLWDIGPVGGRHIAAEFATGPAANGYLLRRITVDTSLLNGSADQLEDLLLELYSGETPNARRLASATSTPARPSQENAVFDFAGQPLTPNTRYFLFWSAENSQSGNSYRLVAGPVVAAAGRSGWSLGEDALGSPANDFPLRAEEEQMRLRIEADAVPGVALSTTTLRVAEGATSSYGISLTTQPAAEVVVRTAWESGDASLSIVSGAALTFATSDWSIAQSVVLSAAADADGVDGTAVFGHAATSTDADYGGIAIADLTALERDRDMAGVVVSTTSVTAVEGGQAAAWTLALATEPLAAVTIAATRNAGGDEHLTIVRGASLTFASSTWSIAQTVEVSAAADDDAANGMAIVSHAASSADADYGASLAIAAVAVSEADDDTAGVTVSTTSIVVAEGGVARYTLVLDTQPLAPVVVSASKRASGSPDPDIAVRAGGLLTFMPGNWSTAQSVELTAAEDDGDSTSGSAVIVHAATSTDAGYHGISIADVAAVEADNDMPGLVLEPSALDVPEGGRATYAVRLAVRPMATVEVAVANRGRSDDDASLVAMPAALTFAVDDWSAAQTVTLSAAADDDPLDGSAVITHTASSTDSDYAGLVAALAAREIDDAAPGLRLFGATSTVPEGGVARYGLALATPPTATVTVAVANRGSGDDDADLSAQPALLTFAPAAWSAAQTVALSAAQDVDTADGSAIFLHTAASADSDYAGLVAAARATEQDDDAARILLAPSPLAVPEGGRAIYGVSLGARPAGPVTIAISRDGSGDADLAGSPTRLTFAGGNFDQPQPVTVSAAQDDDGASGMATFRHRAGSLDADYANAVAVLTAVEADDDAGFAVSAQSVSVPESGEATYVLSLRARPGADVFVAVANRGGSADDADIAAAPALLRFATSSWQLPRTVTVSARADADRANGTAAIGHAARSADSSWNGLAMADVTAVESDDDIPGVTISTRRLVVWEGASSTYSIVLDAAPPAGVSVEVEPAVAGDGSISVSSGFSATVSGNPAAHFTQSNWNMPQIITVAAAADADAENGMATIGHSVVNGDSAYLAVAVASIEVAEDDNSKLRVPSLVVNVGEGESAAYDVALTEQPAANVTVSVARQAGSDSLIAARPAATVFTPADWNMARQFTVAAGNDDVRLNRTATFVHTARSSDARFHMRRAHPVGVRMENDDGLTALRVSALRPSVPEGGTAQYTVALTSAATTTMAIDLALQSQSDRDVTFSPAALTFAAGSWSVAQTVTVSAAEDDDALDGSAGIAHTGRDSNDMAWRGALQVVPPSGVPDFAVYPREADNDQAGVSLSATGSVMREGATTSYRIVLTAQPKGAVVLRIAKSEGGSEGDADISIAPSLLTFSTSTWNAAQIVALSAVQDDDSRDGSVLVRHAVQSGDSDYAKQSPEFLATVIDDDGDSVPTLAAIADMFHPALIPIATATLPRAEGGNGAIRYALAPALPDGLVFVSSTRRIGGTPLLASVRRTYTYSATDADGDAAARAFAIEIGRASQAPTGGDVTFAVEREGRTVLPLWRFPFADPDGDALAGVRIVTVPGAADGVLRSVDANADATGSCASAGDPVAPGREIYDIAGRTLIFCPAEDFSAGSFAFRVRDSLGLWSAAAHEATLLAPPAQPEGFAARGGNGHIRLAWDDPRDPSITGYAYRQRTEDGSFGNWIDIPGAAPAPAVDASASSARRIQHAVGGLASGTRYVFQVRARNAAGGGTPSAEAAASTVAGAAPAKPTGFQAFSLGFNAAVTYIRVGLYWDDPGDPSILRYEAQRQFRGSSGWLKPLDWPTTRVPGSSATTTRAEMDAGSNESVYRFRVRAVNAAGAGPWSDAEELELLDQGHPQLLAAEPGNGRVRLHWSHRGPAFSDAGSSDYWGIRANGGAPSVISDSPAELRAHVATGLANGRSHTYEVFTYGVLQADAINRSVVFSNALTFTLPGAPAKPAGFALRGSQAGAILSWTDPDNASITGYQYREKEGVGSYGPWTRVRGSGPRTTAFAVSERAPGTAYAYQIRAVIEYSAALGGTLAGVASDELSATPVGLALSPAGALGVPEGGTASYAVRLAVQPTSAVTVSLSAAGDGDLSAAPGHLTFQAGAWSVSQTVVVAAAQDNDARAGRAVFAHRAGSLDARYGNLANAAQMEVREIDDDTLGIVLATSSLLLAEGDSGSYPVRLGTQPVGDVTVRLARKPGEGASTLLFGPPAQLRFTNANWSVAQRMSVRAPQDADGADEALTLVHTTFGEDYDGYSAELQVEATDDDRALRLSATRLDVPEGGSATYSVRLASLPAGSVTVAVAKASGAQDDDLTISGRAALTFSTATWNIGQTVTLAAAEDADGDAGMATFVHAASGSGYGGVAEELVAVEADNERGVLLSPATVTVEEGGSAMYAVRLRTAPTAAVTVRVARKSSGVQDANIVVAGGAALTFASTTWNVLQTVTLSATEDADALNGVAVIVHAASGGGYDGVVAELTATEADNERGIVLDAQRIGVPEGATVAYGVRLASEPAAVVTVSVARRSTGNQDTDIRVAGGTALTFTTSDWNQSQSVTLSAVEDADALVGTAVIEHRAAGGGYAGVAAELTAVEEDNERGIALSAASLDVPEGGTAMYSVALSSQPSGSVTVTVARKTTGQQDADISVAGGAALTFSTSDYNQAQSVTLSAREDGDAINGAAVIAHMARGGGYLGVGAELTATEADNERALALSVAATLRVPEGGTAAYSVALASEPPGMVTVSVARRAAAPADADLAIAGPASLTFAPAAWSAAQTLTLSAAEDADGIDGTAVFEHAARGGGYRGVGADLVAVEADDDRAIALSAGSVSVPEGGSATYTVQLAAQPAGFVTVFAARSASGSQDADISVAGTGSVVFGTSTWSTARTITLTAAQDADGIDGRAAIAHTARGGGYADTSAELIATEADDDRALQLSTDRLEVPEGSTATYDVRLAARPAGAVTVTVARAGGSQDADLTLRGAATLVFAAAAWDVGQTVTLAAAEDADDLPGAAEFLHTARSGSYDGLSASLAAVERDNDVKAFVFSPPALTVPENGMASYGVRLQTQPTGAVTVAIARVAGGDQDADLTLAGSAALTFAQGQWSVAQTVAVQAADDADQLAGTADFRHTAAGGGYGAVTGIVRATEDDDDQPDARVGFSSRRYLVAEGQTATIRLATNVEPPEGARVRLTADSPLVSFSAPGLAEDGTLPLDGLSTPVTVTAAHDADASSEEVVLSLSHPQPAANLEIGALGTAVLRIADDERGPTVGFWQRSRTLREGETITLYVLASHAPADGTLPAGSVRIAADGDAVRLGGATFTPDESGSAGTLALTGAWTKLTLTALADADAEDERVVLRLSEPPSGAGLDEWSTATIFVVDAAAPAMHLRLLIGDPVAVALPTVLGGTAPPVLDPELPPGMAFDPATRILSGAPSQLMDPTAYSLTATDDNGDSVAYRFTIEVVRPDSVLRGWRLGVIAE